MKDQYDQIKVVNITGNVKNNCTDSGWANVIVHLNTNNNGSGTQISTITDSRGDFVFNSVSINSNSDYTYTVSIDNLDNYIGGNPQDGDYGHTGVSGEINKDSPGNFLHLGVMGRFYRLHFYLANGTYITPPDTFKLTMEQPIFHGNMPPNVWSLYLPFTNINYTQIINIDNFPMGMWHLYITKIKSGVTTYIHDSVYLDMGCNGNYNIPW